MNLPTSRSFVDRLITELASFQSPLTGIPISGADQSRVPTSINPFTGLPPSQLAQVKPIVLTLHCLFPNDLLPALDILDRRLVHRLICKGGSTTAGVLGLDHAMPADERTHETTNNPLDPKSAAPQSIFLVTSASSTPLHTHPVGAGAPSKTASTQEPDKGYEVRLHSWNCTCPTFALSAFKDLDSRRDGQSPQYSHEISMPMSRSALHDRGGRDEPVIYPFGGTLTRDTDRGSPPVCKHILACILFARCPGLFGEHGDGKRMVSMEEMAGWCAGWGG
ncbi:hypothetical protein N7532_009078 [Penicillium argentinense]|uniref:SWIM-type domain-containing protein n=1 Tax=Penicillium argentinense TaxID=1131581 RepID=A0A9W9EYJ8_9EURO|nr:uncharacterized protein N7532_009078 [Penicillium argentinense]KAJ5090394.1 hypothetical protein N7532_009078 [Penicillium argentinense]